ncbi:MAG: SDR family oxidoreductase [Acidobacteria bacterium]|jgi:uncharacterized protein YbjT (DUF2867 family)|nr:SDR family oxidoreductase [Acidobacteriota bacterium]
MILVTGATGTVGSATVAALRAKDVDLRAASRSPEKAMALGVPAVELDWDRPETLAGAVAGVEKAFLLTPVTNQLGSMTRAFVDAAKQAGVRHVVKLSAIGAGPESIALGRQHGAGEEVIQSSGLDWTMLQPNSFAQNFVNYYGVDPAGDCTVSLPLGDGKASWIDARDVAEVAAAVLTDDGHNGKTYVLTGPTALSAAEALATLGEALGHTYTYVDVSEDESRRAMDEAGIPAWLIDAYSELNAVIKNGYASGVAPGMREVLDREGRTFAEFARDLAAGR